MMTAYVQHLVGKLLFMIRHTSTLILCTTVMKSKLIPIRYDNFGRADSNPCMLACTVTN